MKTIFAFCFLSFNLYAETVPLPPAVTSIDEIVNEFRNTLETKIGELGKNFISRLTDKTIIFTNSTMLDCHGTNIPIGEPVSSLQYNFVKEKNELIEKSIYRGCNNSITLVEDVVTRGEKLSPLKYNDFIKGKREFDLRDDETYRLYRVSNADNEEIFKMLIEKSGKSKLVEFYILGQRFLRMNYEYLDNLTRFNITYFGYQVSYITKYSSWGFTDETAQVINTITATKNLFYQVTYFDIHSGTLSQADYVGRFNKRIINGALARIRKLFEYHNYYFPSTKVIQTGAINAQFKEELRLTFNRLQNNTDLNLVRKQIQDYMIAAESGLIIDNRPKP